MRSFQIQWMHKSISIECSFKLCSKDRIRSTMILYSNVQRNICFPSTICEWFIVKNNRKQFEENGEKKIFERKWKRKMEKTLKSRKSMEPRKINEFSIFHCENRRIFDEICFYLFSKFRCLHWIEVHFSCFFFHFFSFNFARMHSAHILYILLYTLFLSDIIVHPMSLLVN